MTTGCTETDMVERACHYSESQKKAMCDVVARPPDNPFEKLAKIVKPECQQPTQNKYVGAWKKIRGWSKRTHALDCTDGNLSWLDNTYITIPEMYTLPAFVNAHRNSSKSDIIRARKLLHDIWFITISSRQLLAEATAAVEATAAAAVEAENEQRRKRAADDEQRRKRAATPAQQTELDLETIMALIGKTKTKLRYNVIQRKFHKKRNIPTTAFYDLVETLTTNGNLVLTLPNDTPDNTSTLCFIKPYQGALPCVPVLQRRPRLASPAFLSDIIQNKTTMQVKKMTDNTCMLTYSDITGREHILEWKGDCKFKQEHIVIGNTTFVGGKKTLCGGHCLSALSKKYCHSIRMVLEPSNSNPLAVYLAVKSTGVTNGSPINNNMFIRKDGMHNGMFNKTDLKFVTSNH